jgi:hypothetical protein|tara:strand:- start:3111 stop:4070 length:960 start_codon:yes stop_codon:yes gene_type:complete
MVNFTVGSYEYETPDIGAYSPPPGAPPIGAPGSFPAKTIGPEELNYAKLLQNTYSNELIGDVNAGQRAYQFYANRDEQQNNLGRSLLVDPADDPSFYRGLDPTDPGSGQVLSDILTKAGRELSNSQYKNEDLLAKDVGKELSQLNNYLDGGAVSRAGLTAALMGLGLTPSEAGTERTGKESVGQNFLDQMYTSFDESDSSSDASPPGDAGPFGEGYRSFGDYFSGFGDNMNKVAPVNVFGSGLAIPNFLRGLYNAYKYKNPFGPGYGEMDFGGNVIPGTWKGGAGYSEERSPFTGPGGNTGPAGKGNDGPSGGGGGIST